MELDKSKIDSIVANEKEKYTLLYKEDDNYNHNQNKTADMLRGNKKVRREIHKVFNGSKSLLDVGCGKGFYTRYITTNYPNLNVVCVDIAGNEIMKYKPEMKIVDASADKLPFITGYFNVVIHLDGLEHIPVEIEERVIAEEVRVSNKYIYHQISTNPVAIDKEWIDKGYGAIHINIKSEEEWRKSFLYYIKKYGLKQHFFISYKSWLYILLEKKK